MLPYASVTAWEVQTQLDGCLSGDAFCTMLEVSIDDILSLNDADLREAVARLARAELRSRGCPTSAVTAGGSQDAPDGGLDVRVECPCPIPQPDFVPRRLTGFQVKKPDMSAKSIMAEMRPKGILREVIGELADRSGAYIIVSAQGSIADKPLQDRLESMRRAVQDHPTASQLHIDFYDRRRLADWINEYPGVVAWVRTKVGRPLAGWSSVGQWNGDSVLKPYLFDERSFLNQEGSQNVVLGIAEGIKRLRATLQKPRQCVRLVGLSGLGKTRLVQALFEEAVGEAPLDSSLAVYTDYSTPPSPTARDMARDFITRRQRAILVVDNCNPTNHAELAALCTSDVSEISLITVEYDVRDDEPERTEVFRLVSSSPELVAKWLRGEFPHVSHVDIERIGEISDGNFRVARAIAGSVQKGETIGRLKDSELFERIFWQRGEPDQKQLRAAEYLSLLYSIDGEDTSEAGELARISEVSQIDVRYLYDALHEFGRRNIVQSRGRFRAVLPHAIANRLASSVLGRIPPADFDKFCANLTPRIRKSISRRLGLLNDSKYAKKVVEKWLLASGPFGDLFTEQDGFAIIVNAAPAAPEAVLKRLEQELDGPNGISILDQRSPNRREWIRLIKLIAYDAHLFERAAFLLAKFYAVELKRSVSDLTRDSFQELFHLCLSGTQATPEQRRAVVRRLLSSKDPDQQHCGVVAMEALLKTGHFSSFSSHDFGARSRDWGWWPRTEQEASDWFERAIGVAIAFAPDKHAREIIAGKVRGLWRFQACRVALDRVVTTFLKTGPWIDGSIASRYALKRDGKAMEETERNELKLLIERLELRNLFDRSCAVVINRRPDGGGLDISDVEGEEGDEGNSWIKANEMAIEVGRELAQDTTVRAEFLAELIAAPLATRAYNCAYGIGQAADSLSAMWSEIVSMCEKPDSNSYHVIQILAGFLKAARERDESFVSDVLGAMIDNPKLAESFPSVQGRLGVDADGVERVRVAMKKGLVDAAWLRGLAVHGIEKAPTGPLVILIEEISKLSDGVEVAIDVLQTYLMRSPRDSYGIDERIVSVGRELLTRVQFQRGRFQGGRTNLDYEIRSVILACLGGESAAHAAKEICRHLCVALRLREVFSYDVEQTLSALFQAQPLIALDVFLSPQSAGDALRAFDLGFRQSGPVESLDHSILREWANRDPAGRYPILGEHIQIFQKRRDDKDREELSPCFVVLLDETPDKLAFLGDFADRLHAQGGSGSFVDSLNSRKMLLMEAAEKFDEVTRRWIEEGAAKFDLWREQVRRSERSTEESFE